MIRRNVANFLQSQLFKPLLGVVVVKVGYPGLLILYHAILSNIMTKAGAKNYSKVNRKTQLLKLQCNMHGHILDSYDVINCVVAVDDHVQLHDFINEKLVVGLLKTLELIYGSG